MLLVVEWETAEQSIKHCPLAAFHTNPLVQLHALWPVLVLALAIAEQFRQQFIPVAFQKYPEIQPQVTASTLVDVEKLRPLQTYQHAVTFHA